MHAAWRIPNMQSNYLVVCFVYVCIFYVDFKTYYYHYFHYHYFMSSLQMTSGDNCYHGNYCYPFETRNK